MRIVFTMLSGIGYGGMTYFRNLIPALAHIDTENEYHLVVPDGHPLIEEVHATNILFHAVVPAQTSVFARMRYEQFALPQLLRSLHADLCYTAKNLAIFRAPCAVVTAIRNMEPFRYREFTNAWTLDAQSRLKWELTKRSIARADAIVAVSQAVRDAVVERFPDAAAKLRVVYNGNSVIQTVDHQRRESSCFLLSASKFVAYANQLALVEAYAILRAARPHAPPLWFAGGVHDAKYFAAVQRRVAELQLTPHVQFLGLLPQSQLHEFMRSCAVFVFPSMLESCPHTLLEAMACGAPIATSTTPPMPEICGEAAIYFDPRDPAAIANALAEILDSAVLRERLVAAGYVRVAEFTWEKTARGLVEVFESVRCIRSYPSVARVGEPTASARSS